MSKYTQVVGAEARQEYALKREIRRATAGQVPPI